MTITYQMSCPCGEHTCPPTRSVPVPPDWMVTGRLTFTSPDSDNRLSIEFSDSGITPASTLRDLIAVAQGETAENTGYERVMCTCGAVATAPGKVLVDAEDLRTAVEWVEWVASMAPETRGGDAFVTVAAALAARLQAAIKEATDG